MSRENVDKTRAFHERWDEGDLEKTLAFAAPRFEFVTSGAYPGLDAVYRGHEGFRKFWRDFHEPWDNLRITVEELRDVGDQVVALIRFQATAREGMDVRRDGAAVATFEDGLMIRNEAFGDWDAALEAVGLRE